MQFLSSIMPTEDQGYVMVIVQLPNAPSLERTKQVMAQVRDIVVEVPVTANSRNHAGQAR
jgi:multidrug efflux pump subunit AcrB